MNWIRPMKTFYGVNLRRAITLTNHFISVSFFNNGPLHWLNGPGSEPSNVQHMVSRNEIALAIENERKLIGQELHDNVNQILTTVKLLMEMLRPSDKRDR